MSELKAKLEETRQRVRTLTVIGLRPEPTPRKRAAVHECERLARVEVKLRLKVLDLERRRVLERGRARALDHADVALGLLRGDPHAR